MADKQTVFKNWKDNSSSAKILFIVQLIISLSIIVLAALQIAGVWEKAINIFEPLLGVLLLIQAAQNWKKSKPAAYFSLLAAVVVFAITIVVFLK